MSHWKSVQHPGGLSSKLPIFRSAMARSSLAGDVMFWQIPKLWIIWQKLDSFSYREIVIHELSILNLPIYLSKRVCISWDFIFVFNFLWIFFFSRKFHWLNISNFNKKVRFNRETNLKTIRKMLIYSWKNSLGRDSYLLVRVSWNPAYWEMKHTRLFLFPEHIIMYEPQKQSFVP